MLIYIYIYIYIYIEDSKYKYIYVYIFTDIYSISVLHIKYIGRYPTYICGSLKYEQYIGPYQISNKVNKL